MVHSKSLSGEVAGVFFWRRVDCPGHDSCRLLRLKKHGWRLSGAAVFHEAGQSCHLTYDVHTDVRWRTLGSTVVGFVGVRAIDLSIQPAADGFWRLNGRVSKYARGCTDLDLGFTPATNLIALRRLALKVGQEADAPAAYLRFPQMKLTELPQHYRRVGRTAYEYESPTAGYKDVLEVAASGEVIRYPGIFESVAG
jgi:hypothetical protein